MGKNCGAIRRPTDTTLRRLPDAIHGMIFRSEDSCVARRFYKHFTPGFVHHANSRRFFGHGQACLEIAFRRLAILQVEAPPTKMQVADLE